MVTWYTPVASVTVVVEDPSALTLAVAVIGEPVSGCST